MKTITFRFADDKLANAFLGYMSDGGGEYHFIDGPDVSDVRFEYHKPNGGRFGPLVDVTGRYTPREVMRGKRPR